MKRTSAALFAGLALLTSGAPAFSDDGLASILFGKNYNDGVMAVQILPRSRHDGESLPQAVLYPTQARKQQAQATITHDPALLEALNRREISLHNVAWVQTAMNGGKIIYYY